MKILHIIPSVDESKGGPSRAVLDMAQALTQKGITNTIVTCNIDPQKTKNYSGAELIGFKSTVGERWGFSPALGKWIEANISNYEVVHIHSFFSYTSWRAATEARKHQIPYVLRPAGALDQFSFNQKRFKKQMFFDSFGKTILQNASAVHCTSQFEEKQIHEKISGTKTIVIPLGTFVAREQRKVSSNAGLKILYLGRLHPHKGLELLLESVAELKSKDYSVQLMVAGDGDNSYKKKLRIMVQALKITERIIWTGALCESGKKEWFSKADVFALPSEHENFGISVIEAMASGLPVIVSDQVGVASEVKKAKAGLVIRATVPQFVLSVEHFLKNPVDINTIGKNGEDLVNQNFRWPKIANQLVALYESIQTQK